eukprot:gene14654-20688_t
MGEMVLYAPLWVGFRPFGDSSNSSLGPGDSRAVISRSGVAERLTEDHKPQLPLEPALRVEKGPQRGGPPFRVSRGALGDIDFKEPRRFVESEPDVKRLVPKPGDSFVVLASDGLWDVLSDQESVDCVEVVLKGCPGWSDSNFTSSDAKIAAEALLALSIKKGTVDNVTVVIQLLHWSSMNPSVLLRRAMAYRPSLAKAGGCAPRILRGTTASPHYMHHAPFSSDDQSQRSRTHLCHATSNDSEPTKSNCSTPFGAFLDPVADKLMVAATLILLCSQPIAAGPLMGNTWVMPSLTLAIIGREITMSALREWAATLGPEARKAMVSLVLLLWCRDGGTDQLIQFCGTAGPVLLVIATWLTLHSLGLYFYALRKFLF